MGKFNVKVDAYVAKSAPFAKPIAEFIRELVHTACPGIEETIKWGFPHFEYKGIVCSFAAFKNHCGFSFWKGTEMTDPHKLMTTMGKTSMGNFNKITCITDLPSEKILIQYIKEAVKLNEEGIKVNPKQKLKKTSEVKIPADFISALKKNKITYSNFEKLSNSHKKDYVEWITEAKTEITRNKRMNTAIEWIAEGKRKNWKYER